MLYRGMGSPEVSGPELDQYQDAASVSDWAVAPLLWCVQTGLIAGTTDTSLSPASPITVRQALVILERASYLPDMDVLQRDIEELAPAITGPSAPRVRRTPWSTSRTALRTWAMR